MNEINLGDQTVAYVRNTRRVRGAAKDALAMPSDRIARLMGAHDSYSVLETMQAFHRFIADTDTDRARWTHELDAWNDFRSAQRSARAAGRGSGPVEPAVILA